MDNELKQVVAELFDADLHKVNAGFLLSTRRMQGSLARAKLDAAIRHRLGVKCRAVYSVQTYGELENAVLGTSSSSDESNSSDSNVSTTMISKASVMPPVNLIGSTSALSCGIDVEMVENFPKVDDYWKESFYTNSFSAVEIAYCLLQENPPMHFAARWCAKEALKKCEPSYMHEEMKKIELMASGDGSPILRYYRNGHPIVLPVAVSISHTTQIAVAVVCK